MEQPATDSNMLATKVPLPPQCVIVSADRFNDIEPFMRLLYEADSLKWGSIFPWEFPQSAPKEVEDSFLVTQFDQEDVQMQGFQFLKQVWYSCALFNLDRRLPAFADWYWTQPDNLAVINDPAMRQYILKGDTQLSSFFKNSDIETYGKKFLLTAIPLLKKRAAERDESEKAPNQAAESPSVNIPLRKNLNENSGAKAVQSAPLAQPEQTSTHPEHQNPPSSRRATVSTLDRPQVPLSISTSAQLPPLHARTTPYTAVPAPQEMNPQSRKRGNSGNKRFNNRGGHFHHQSQHRQPSHLPERDLNIQHLPPAFHGPPTAMAPGTVRGPYGTHGEFIQSPPPGQPPMSMAPYHQQYVPGQFGQQGRMLQNQMMGFQAPAQGHSPVWMPDSVFHQRDTNRLPDANFQEELRSFSNEAFGSGHGPRRFSQSSRGGGKSRGNNSIRGRGRGRESFNREDRPHFGPGAHHDQRPPVDQRSTGGHIRRGSVVNERNWRSGSEHPQFHATGLPAKENMIPGQHSFSYGYPAPEGAHSQPAILMGTPQKPPMHMGGSFPALRSDSAAGKPRATTKDSFSSSDKKRTCSRDRIGAACCRATRLLAFNVPADISEQELFDYFNSYAPVASVKRGKPKPNGSATPLVWMNFESHHVAIQFLQQKPEFLLGNAHTRVEVPKEFWDPDHANFEDPTLPIVDFGRYRGYEAGFSRPFQGTQVPNVLQRPNRGTSSSPSKNDAETTGDVDHSADTTPTPSGASTPKKKNNKKKKKQEADLRKASLALSNDAKQTAGPGESRELKSRPSSRGSQASGRADKGEAASNSEEKEQSKSNGKSNKKSVEETAGLETPSVSTVVPKSEESTSKKQDNDGTQESVTCDQRESATAPGSSENQLQDFRPFQAKAEKASPKTKEVVQDEGELVRDKKSSSNTAMDTPSKAEDDHVDDSFHTASGSPNSPKQETAGVVQDESQSANEVEQHGDQALGAPALKEFNVESTPAPSENAASEPTVDGPASPQTSKKAPVPQIPPKPKITISTSDSEVKPDDSTSEQRSTSGNTVVPPTPSFVTAPNTPAVGHEKAVVKEVANNDEAHATKPPAETDEAVKADTYVKDQQTVATSAEKDTKPRQASVKKAEKPKGPAATESLSLYGKKNEKKAKGGKKGTLKGKPKSGAASESSSRAVSGATTLGADDGAQEQSAKKDGDTASREESEGKTKSTKADTSMDGTPSKRGGLGDFFSKMIGGGQKSHSPSRTRSNSSVSKSSLTKSKAPDHHPSAQTDAHNLQAGSSSGIDVHDQSAADQKPADAAPAESIVDKTSAQADEDITKDIATAKKSTELDGESTLGLGISNAISDKSAQNSGGSKKKKPNKKKTKAPSTTEQSVNSEQQEEVAETSSPAVVESKRLQDVFHFTKGGSPPISVHTDHGSDASSQTLDRLTPGSDIPSPTLTQSARKLPARPPGSTHLMEAKQPAWKQKKRIGNRTQIDASTDGDDGPTVFTLHTDNASVSDVGENTSPADDATPTSPGGTKREQFYVYVGAPLMDDMDEDTPKEDGDHDLGALQKLAGGEILRRAKARREREARA